MTKQEVYDFTNSKLNEFNLKEWIIGFDKTKSRAAVCKERKKLISFSIYYIESATEEQIKNTALHEIAHAIVGAKEGHNKVWKAKAIEIGCKGDRCCEPFTVPKEAAKYISTCPNCKGEKQWYRKPKAKFNQYQCYKTEECKKQELIWTTPNKETTVKNPAITPTELNNNE